MANEKTMYYPVAVPVKPHVKQFILRNTEGEPVPVTMENRITRLLLPLLTKQPVHTANEYANMKAVVNFKVCERYVGGFGHSITHEGAYMFNEIIDDIFREMLFAKLDLAVQHNGYRMQIKTVIYDFIEYYGMNEDDHVSYDTLKKDYYRSRKKVNQTGHRRLKIFSHGLSPEHSKVA